MLRAAGIFLLGFGVALLLEHLRRAAWIRRLPPRCSVPGCERHSDHAVMKLERYGMMQVREAWALCTWCAGSAAVTVRGSPLRFPTVGVFRHEYERVAVAVNRLLNGELFDLVSYVSGWVWRRRTFTLGPINTTTRVRLMWLSPLDAGSHYQAKVDGVVTEINHDEIATPIGSMVEIVVTRPRALTPYRASLALVVGPLYSEPPP